MSYVRYRDDAAAAPRDRGWDEWAKEYAALGASNPTYAMGKELLHAMVDEWSLMPEGHEPWVLDFHCGAGDDSARFLARGWRVAGCDGSRGMLHEAAVRCAADLRAGRIELWHGRAEELAPESFAGRRFDLVFSTTGGFAYLDDDQFVRVHRLLAAMVAPGGIMVLAHLTPFCPADTIYHLLRLHPRRAIQRWAGTVQVPVRGEPMRMHLRSPGRVRRLLAGVVRLEGMFPLLVCTPPFQTGFAPGPRLLATLKAVERAAGGIAALASLADQVVCVARPASSSSNNAT